MTGRISSILLNETKMGFLDKMARWAAKKLREAEREAQRQAKAAAKQQQKEAMKNRPVIIVIEKD